MAISSNSIVSFTYDSLSHLGRTSQPHLLNSITVKFTHRSNSALHCSSINVPEYNIYKKDIPIEKRFPPYPTVMDINEILKILPHRFPFLLVDRIIEYNPGVSVVGIKNVTINDNFFCGHFPERPIMPGVLMIEAMAQVGGAVMLQQSKEGVGVVGASGELFLFVGIDKVRFRKPVVPGDTLIMRMTLMKLQKRFKFAKLKGKAYVGPDLVCEAEFLMATTTSTNSSLTHPTIN